MRFGILLLSKGKRRGKLERWFEAGVRRIQCLAWEAETGLRWAEVEIPMEPLVTDLLVIGGRSGSGTDVVRQRLSLRDVGSALEIHLHRSRQRAAELEKHCPVWVHRLTTDHKSVREVADEVLDLTGWT